MKTIFALIIFCALWIGAIAQIHQKMSCQAVVRDAAEGINARYVNFSNGNHGWATKGQLFRVRSVRTF